MASPAITAPQDTPVSVKITIAGTEEHKKFRLTLKDLGPNTLPDKLREQLAVSPSQETIFQRFSDSSASWIALNSSEPSVYKQLYRAAKAKGRLRLRVTIEDKDPQAHKGPATPVAPVERLPTSSYVQPYVTDAGADQSPSSRISMLEDFKTLSAAPSSITMTPTHISSEGKADGPRHFWPIGKDSAFGEKTKNQFERPQSTSSATNGTAVKFDESGEAPVPGFFDFNDEQFLAPSRHRCPVMAARAKMQNGRAGPTRESCLTKMAQIQHKHVAERQAAASNAHSNFVIWCNQCDSAIPDAHWHCSLCDGGDYDICLKCADNGAICANEQHWLIKRFFRDGKIITSTTETLAPKKLFKPEEKKEIPCAYKNELKIDQTPQAQRTCNACVQVYPEREFITCTVCDDYDLCKDCLIAEDHGHHPAHRFEPAVSGIQIAGIPERLLVPGRDFHHAAVCDGCDKPIVGVRHKCLDCPDWDYCETCALSAAEIHPGHRLAHFYEAVESKGGPRSSHYGVFCDGPLCTGTRHHIIGDRYKCAVCHDTDFCSRCEALPILEHNRTHPLLKFKTPIRNVSVSTYGEKANGEAMKPMGDQTSPRSTSSKSTETTPPAPSSNASTQAQPVAEAAIKEESASTSEQAQTSPKIRATSNSLKAQFMYDTVTDGTVIAPATVFTQTWTLTNPGPRAWPAGCSVCFVGGDSMFNVDPNHPSSILQLNKALSTNVVEREVLKGEKIEFSVTMRTQERQGKAVSYWRLKTADGTPFGHRLWCDINVRKLGEVSKDIEVESKTEPASSAKSKSQQDTVKEEENEAQGSQMIFPKLEKESPVSSYHETESAAADAVVVNKAVLSPAEQDLLEDVESLELDDDDSDSGEDGFLTDEEYELIASGDEMEVAKNGKK